MNELKSTELIVTAQPCNDDIPTGEPYQFRVHEFENGLIIDDNEIFFSEREELETSCNRIISIKDTGKSKIWKIREIIDLARCSVRFGSLPKKLFTLLEDYYVIPQATPGDSGQYRIRRDHTSRSSQAQ